MDVLVVFLLFSSVIVGIAYYNRRRAQTQQFAEAERQKISLQNYMADFQRIGEEYQKNGIPSIESDISLKKTDTLYAILKGSSWMEYRKVRTGRVSGHGITGRVKIAKGLYYRYGTGQYHSESLDQLTTIDQGDFYVTDKGLFFRGSKGNKTLPFEKILELVPFENGMKIERETGKDIYIPFRFSNSPEKAAAIVLLWDKRRNA